MAFGTKKVKALKETGTGTDVQGRAIHQGSVGADAGSAKGQAKRYG